MTRQAQVKAKRYLYRICELVGAVVASPIGTGVARYHTKEYEFLIRPHSVDRTNFRTGQKQHTCVMLKQRDPRMPEEEMIATILLRLHDDPTQFDTWYSQSTIPF